MNKKMHFVDRNTKTIINVLKWSKIRVSSYRGRSSHWRLQGMMEEYQKFFHRSYESEFRWAPLFCSIWERSLGLEIVFALLLANFSPSRKGTKHGRSYSSSIKNRICSIYVIFLAGVLQLEVELVSLSTRIRVAIS